MLNLRTKRTTGLLAVGLLLISSKAFAAPRPEVNEVSAEAAFNQGQYQSSIAQYQRLLRVRPDDVGYQTMLAKSYEVTGEMEKARQYASAVLNSHRNNFDALLVMGRIHAREQDWANARSYYQRAVTVDKTSSMALLGLSQSLMELGEFDAAEIAIADYRRLAGISEP